MKTEKWMLPAAFAILLSATASCDDWGSRIPGGEPGHSDTRKRGGI